MGFEKGQPRPPGAGRKPGSKNKRKIARVSDFLAEREINPAEKILEIVEAKHVCDEECKDEAGNDCWRAGRYLVEAKDRIDAWLDLLSYCQPKPKEVEMPEDEDEDLENIPTAELLKLVKPGNA